MIRTPAGAIELLGRVRIEGRLLTVQGAHVQGLHPGALGREGLNAVGRALLEVADAETLVIEGGARTTGRNAGRAPRPVRFPRERPAEQGE